jgi:Putative zinc-finger
MTHPSVEDFEAWTMGRLPFAANARFEAHVAQCPACARQLTQEARLTEALRVATQPKVARVAQQFVERVAALRPVLMAAAALAAVLVVPRSADSGEAPGRQVSAPRASVDVRQLGRFPRYEAAMMGAAQW